MHDHQTIIDTLRTFAHRSDLERVDEAIEALHQFGDEDEFVRGVAREELDVIV